MIQFNLLPDVKLEYIKAARTKRLVISISALVIAAVIGLVGLISLSVLVLQKRHLNNLNNDIATYRQELEDTGDLNKILTVQNQLNSLPGLHQQKPASSRIFSYIGQLTPEAVSISRMQVDFLESTMHITGQVENDREALKNVNLFVDTLKFTKYKAGQDGEEANAFSSVVLSNTSRTRTTASYEITLSFDPQIFNINEDIRLLVPKDKITTRSETQKPVFEQAPKEEQ
jgi:hypothetical protein